MKFFTLFVLIFILTGCSIRCHGDTILSLSSSPGVFTLDNKYAYIVVKPLYYQRAAGLCSFPDGGISKSIYTSLDLYKINVETGDIHKVYSLADQDLEGYTLNVGTSPNLFTTNKDNQYFFLSPEAHLPPGDSY